MKKQTIFFLFLFSFSFCAHIFAQDSPPDSSNRQAISFARMQYMKTTGANSSLYNGVAYEHYWNRVNGHPFFMTDQFQQGTVWYDGNFYESVPLLYDMNRDELVSKTFAKNNNLKLLSEKIRSFTIGTHEFVRIVGDSTAGTWLATGFYERLYNGVVSVLLKHENKIEQSFRAEDNVSRFAEHDYYYIEKDGKYYTVQGEGDLQNIFKDHKAEMRKFLNRRDINYKKDPSKTIVQAAAYYAQLKK